MPIYEYRCATCDHQFEALILRSSETAELACPRCSAAELERVLSAPAPTASCDTGGG